MRETTEIRIDEHGDETHESWITVGGNRTQHSPPGKRLFDSEINHMHYVHVKISRCTRKRDLKRDWIHTTKLLMEFSMSEAQWGAFISSFGQGGGVPATLEWHNGEQIPEAPFESRLDESAKEVRDAGEEAVASIKEKAAKLWDAFDRKAGRKEMRELLRDLNRHVENVPQNMEYTARSLTEHVENTVAKAKYDIEAAALAANPELTEGTVSQLLGPGEKDA